MNSRFLALAFSGFLMSCASEPRTSGTGTLVPLKPLAQTVSAKDLPQGLNKVAAGPIVYRSSQDSPEVGRFYQAARKLYDQGQTRDALVQFKKYVQAAPTGQFVDEALYLLAKDSYDNNDFDGASKSYRSIVAFDPPSRLRGDALYLDAVCQYNLGNRKEALLQLSKLDLRELSVAQKPKIFPFWGRAASEEGRWLEAALALIKARSMTDDAHQKTQIEQLVEDQIESRLSEAELNFILQEYPNTYPAPQIQMRLVSLKMASGKRAEAKELLMGILNQSAPDSLLHKKAADLSGRLQSLGDALPTRVGALLPLSGPRADQGRAVADGLQMAFAANNTSGIELVLADTGPTDESAVKAFERLVFEDRVMAVVGPLYGSAADLVATKAAELGVPNLALSARSGLIEKGPFVFRLALTPERQVRAAVGYAKEKLGAKRFAVIFPQDSFGREFALEYIRAVEDFDGTVTAIASYDPKQSDFKAEIEDLIGTGFSKFRATEIKENKQRIEDALQRPATDKELEGRLMPPIVDFDVLFLPDTYKALGQIAPALVYADIRNVQLMGPATWRNAQLLNRAGHYLEKALFVDSFATERQSRVTRDFVEKFEKSKGKLPSSFAAQGFDVGTALRQAYSSGRTPQNRDDLRARLATLGSFDGVMGMQTWDARREALSEMQLFEIRKSNFQHLGGITIRPRKD